MKLEARDTVFLSENNLEGHGWQVFMLSLPVVLAFSPRWEIVEFSKPHQGNMYLMAGGKPFNPDTLIYRQR